MGFGTIEDSPFRNLFVLKNAQSRRVSSWDRTGGNRDWISIGPRETATLLDAPGSGCVTHFYWTMIGNDPHDLRRAVIRMFWDGQDTPSVEAPLGDFFGAPNCIVPVFASPLMTINKGMGVSARSELAYTFKPKYKAFVAVVGIDDEMIDFAPASVTFQVLADDRLLKETPIMRPGQYWHLNVKLPADTQRVRLIVTDAGDGINGDHGDWANAGFRTE